MSIHLVPLDSGGIPQLSQVMTLDESDHKGDRYYCPFHDSSKRDLRWSGGDGYTCYGVTCNSHGVALDDHAYGLMVHENEQFLQNGHGTLAPVVIDWGGSGDDWFDDEPEPEPEPIPVPAKTPAPDVDWNNVIREHIYTDEHGNNIKKKSYYGFVGADGKQPIQYRWDNELWKSGLTFDNGDKVPLYPYKIQNLLAQDSKAVLLVEGEKDVDSLHTIGIPNVTTYGSANLPKMDERNLSYFKGKTVYIVLDNDRAGYQFGREMGNLLFNVASSVKICFIPNLKHKGDVSDYIAEHNPTLDALKKNMISNSYLYEECSEKLNKFEDEFETLLGLNEALGKHKKFPIECFPKKVRNYSLVEADITNTYVEYHTLGLMTGLFGLLQGKFSLRVYGSWLAFPSGVFVLVGDSGESKSHPIKGAIRKTKGYDEDYIERFDEQLASYNEQQEKKKEKGYKKPTGCEWDGIGEVTKPIRRPYLTTKFTMEGLRESLRFNRKGLVAHINEMDTLFGMMGAYKQGGKGDDASFFMNIIDGEDAVVDLARESIRIKNPRCSLIGTVQRKTVKNLYTEQTKDLGFAFRFLFAQPWEKKYYTMRMLTEDEQAKSDKVTNKIDELYDTIKEYCIECKDEVGALEIVNWADDNAFKCFMNFNNNYVNGLRSSYDNIDADIGGVLSKIVSFTPKIALGLQLIKFFSDETETKDVELETVQDAIKIMKYFLYNNYIILHTTGSEDADKDYLFFLDYMSRYKVKGTTMIVSKVRQRKRKGYLLGKDIIDAVNRLVAQDKAEWVEKDKEFKIK